MLSPEKSYHIKHVHTQGWQVLDFTLDHIKEQFFWECSGWPASVAIRGHLHLLWSFTDTGARARRMLQADSDSRALPPEGPPRLAQEYSTPRESVCFQPDTTEAWVSRHHHEGHGPKGSSENAACRHQQPIDKCSDPM